MFWCRRRTRTRARTGRIGVNAYYFKLSAGLIAFLNALCLRWITGIKVPKRSSVPGRAVPPRGWYSKYRRNVDQLTPEPGGARAVMLEEWPAGRQAAPAITQRATRGLSPINYQELWSGLWPSSRFCWTGFYKCNICYSAHLQNEYFWCSGVIGWDNLEVVTLKPKNINASNKSHHLHYLTALCRYTSI